MRYIGQYLLICYDVLVWYKNMETNYSFSLLFLPLKRRKVVLEWNIPIISIEFYKINYFIIRSVKGNYKVWLYWWKSIVWWMVNGWCKFWQYWICYLLMLSAQNNGNWVTITLLTDLNLLGSYSNVCLFQPMMRSAS
jgi:hypothetical protein